MVSENKLGHYVLCHIFNAVASYAIGEVVQDITQPWSCLQGLKAKITANKKRVGNHLRTGDLVLAFIDNIDGEGVEGTITGYDGENRELGVVVAKCKCGRTLMIDNGLLRCPCGYVESHLKHSKFYGCRPALKQLMAADELLESRAVILEAQRKRFADKHEGRREDKRRAETPRHTRSFERKGKPVRSPRSSNGKT